MHISEGILSGSIIGGGVALTAIGTTIGLKSLDYDKIARAGVLSAAFFVTSLVQIPIGPANVHLVMNGLVGLLLGWVAFPVILTALILQALFFQFGGITTLGVNTVIMAAPAVLVRFLFGKLIWHKNMIGQITGFLCGFTAVLMGTIFIAAALLFSGEAFVEITGILVTAHLPIMMTEGFVTLFAVMFLKKVQPALLPYYQNVSKDFEKEGHDAKNPE